MNATRHDGTRAKRLRLLRTGIFALAVTLLMAVTPLFGSVATPKPAAAQGSGQVSFCAVLPGQSPAANFNVTLYWLGPNGLDILRTGKTNGNGCGTFYQVPLYRYLNISVKSPSGVWSNASGNFWYPDTSYVKITVWHV